MQKNSLRKIAKSLGLICATAFTSAILINTNAKAEVSVNGIDYEKMTITLGKSADETIMFSDKNKTKWYIVPGSEDNETTIDFDISWISAKKDYQINFKTDAKDSKEVSLTLPKQETGFTAKFDKKANNGEGQITYNLYSYKGRTDSDIQWRKSVAYNWDAISSINLSDYYTKGTTLYFRLKPIKGTSITDVGKRASNQSKLTIPKKPNGPFVKVDGQKLSITVASTMQYKLSTVDTWTDIPAGTTSLKISEVAPDLMAADIVDGSSTTASSSPANDVTVDIRKKATTSSMSSKTSSVKVPKQDAAPTAPDINYIGSAAFELNVSDATTNNAYEYTIVKPNNIDNFDITKASWTKITDKKAINISKTKAPEGSKLYVRKCTIAEKKDEDGNVTTEFKLASACKVFTINGYLAPSQNTTNKVFEKIIGTEDTFTASIKVPTTSSTVKVESIGYYENNDPESNLIKFDIISQSAASQTDGKTITIKFKPSSEFENKYADDTFPIAVNVTGNDPIISTADNGIRVLIHSKSTIENGATFTQTRYVQSDKDYEINVKLGKGSTGVKEIKIGNDVVDANNYLTADTGIDNILKITIKKEFLKEYANNFKSSGTKNIDITLSPKNINIKEEKVAASLTIKEIAAFAKSQDIGLASVGAIGKKGIPDKFDISVNNQNGSNYKIEQVSLYLLDVDGTEKEFNIPSVSWSDNNITIDSSSLKNLFKNNNGLLAKNVYRNIPVYVTLKDQNSGKTLKIDHGLTFTITSTDLE